MGLARCFLRRRDSMSRSMSLIRSLIRSRSRAVNHRTVRPGDELRVRESWPATRCDAAQHKRLCRCREWLSFGKYTLTRIFCMKYIKGVESVRSEEHTSELQSLRHLVCRLLLE